MTGVLRIVPATEADVPLILDFVRKLAEYEKLSHEVVATEAGLRDGLFGARKVAEVLLAYWAEEPAGLRCFFTTSPHSSASPAFIWRTCSSKRSIAAGGSGRAF